MGQAQAFLKAAAGNMGVSQGVLEPLRFLAVFFDNFSSAPGIRGAETLPKLYRFFTGFGNIPGQPAIKSNEPGE